MVINLLISFAMLAIGIAYFGWPEQMHGSYVRSWEGRPSWLRSLLKPFLPTLEDPHESLWTRLAGLILIAWSIFRFAAVIR